MIKRDDVYWERKIQSFLHDPVDKALSIPGHEERAKKIADAFGTTTADKSEVARADITAAGIDRARLPRWDSDPQKNGAVDFKNIPVLTHPLADHKLGFAPLALKASETTDAVFEVINEDLKEGSWNRQSYFNYLFFGLRKSLAAQNTCGLGFLWERLPADTRMPDHSIWTHCGLVSALKTCFSESADNQAALVVFALTPVQPFIEKSRKLRDQWVGSVILSWLAFEGIKAVMNFLGPDHVMYPSLHDQPLVKTWLGRKDTSHFGRIFKEYEALSPLIPDGRVASLPNKFVFLAPAGHEAELCEDIQKAINAEWQILCGHVADFIQNQTGGDNPSGGLTDQFKRQTENYWRLNYSYSKLITLSDQEDLQRLFKTEKFESVFKTVDSFMAGFSKTLSVVYPASHSLAQAVMAAAKTKPVISREEEPGKKCPVCGEFEILHDGEWPQTPSASDDRKVRDGFWGRFRVDTSTLKEGEQLCGLCSVKRFAPRAIREYAKSHVLYPVFQKDDFPSTTEMASGEWLAQLEHQGLLHDSQLRSLLIDELHECDEENKPFSSEIQDLLKKANKEGLARKEQDKYYAILIMDGDKMGDLINGKTIGACWRDVLHPDLATRFGQKGFPGGVLETCLDKQRYVSPAVHASISEALGSFSLYAVPWVVEDCGGRLIYAGGDDVAAVLPLSKVMEAAERISQLYRQGFVAYSVDGIEACGSDHNMSRPFAVFPGKADSITISGGILICHHKQPLRGAIEEAHRLLNDIAKKRMGRNAFAVKLLKRSGHSRVFGAKWDALNSFCGPEAVSLYDSFREIMAASSQGLISTSVVYRLEGLSIPILSVVGKSGDTLSGEAMESVVQLLAYEIGHSGVLKDKYPGEANKRLRKREARRLACHVAGLVLRWNSESGDRGAWEFSAQAPEMAVFLSKGGMK